MAVNMAQSRPARRAGNWVEIVLLGSGGFGTVVLWTNEENNEHIALKKCRLQSEMSAKHRRRWELEVDIMKRLEHDNVVSARDVPPELDVAKEEMPLLAMEYCSGGDLRKILNKPEYCCGMKEFQVRCLVQDISGAIEYLHGKRIIHRDLKPENIVLQDGEEKTIYKLIDLGYAKELDQGSVCTSFVGTLQYLAPELFASQKYTCTVDYWSFGTVVFECITGIRPFLPTMAPVRWHGEVCRKSADDIGAVVDVDGIVKFNKRIPAPNHLCRTLQAYFEQWLRLMLRWDPKLRGGGLNNLQRPKCFILLENILAMKIVHVLHVASNQLVSYPVIDENSLMDLQRIIEQETKIPIAEQEILLPSGICPDPEKTAASQIWSQPTDEDWVIFLFRKSNEPEYGNDHRKLKALPALVQNIVKEPKTLLPYQEQRRAWSEAVFFCQDQETDLKRLILAQRAAMLCLLRLNSIYLKLKKKMMKDVGQLQARMEYFRASLDHDIQKYQEQASSGGITSSSMFTKWKKMGVEINQFAQLRTKVGQLDDQSCALQTKIVELQRSPFTKSKQSDVLEDLTSQAQKLYQELRQAPKEQRNAFDHTKMVQILVRCITVRDKATSDLYTHLSKVSECKTQLEELMPRIQECCQSIIAGIEQLSTYQKQRQNDMWYFVRVALQRVGNSGSPRAGMLQQDSQLSTTQSLSSSTYMSDTSSPTSGHESLKLMEDNKETRNQLSSLMDNVIHEGEEALMSITTLEWDNFLHT